MKKSKYLRQALIILVLVMGLLTVSHKVSQAKSYDIYVNQDNKTGIEDGTKAHPYSTITQALDTAKEKDEILIKNGTYKENIKIPRKVKVYGENKSKVVIDGGDDGSAVIMGHKSKLKKLTVKGGNNGIKVPEKTGVKIKNVKIKKADKYGILLEGSGKTLEKKDRYKREIQDSTIKDNEKGMYIRKSNVVIEDSKIIDNDEEGIDMRKGVKATIKNNELEGNGEGNLEFKIDKADVKIKGNAIKKAGRSGISVQTYQGIKGFASIVNNEITGNDHYGLKCSTEKRGRNVNWSNVLFLSKNTYGNNDKGTYSSFCNF